MFIMLEYLEPFLLKYYSKCNDVYGIQLSNEFGNLPLFSQIFLIQWNHEPFGEVESFNAPFLLDILIK